MREISRDLLVARGQHVHRHAMLCTLRYTFFYAVRTARGCARAFRPFVRVLFFVGLVRVARTDGERGNWKKGPCEFGIKSAKNFELLLLVAALIQLPRLFQKILVRQNIYEK